ncbi:MAG: hypothetical protein ACLFPE_07175, partial [Bacteroidales bacterium]
MINQISKKYLPAIAMVILLLIPAGMEILAQLPTHVPDPEAEPVRFFDNWGKFFFYIVLPAVVIILYFVWRNKNRKEQRKREEEEKKRER